MKRPSYFIRLVAVSLLVCYTSITTLADLFHNHHDLVQRDDCPACLWAQMSQDYHPDDTLTTQTLILTMVVGHLPAPLESTIIVSGDFITGTQPRAPPTPPLTTF